MAISTYSKNGRDYYKVYVQARGKQDPSIRIQKKKTAIESLQQARKIEKKLFKNIIEQVAKLEGYGLTWGDIVDQWETKSRLGELGDKFFDRQYRVAHFNRVTNYTSLWWRRRAAELTKGDGRQVLNLAKESGAGVGLLKNIKSSVNIIFNWALEEKLVIGVNSSPVQGLVVASKEEKVPKILTLDEVRTLLRKAKNDNNIWYPIWAFAILTGMRSGELMALQWRDIDLEKGIITVSKSYNGSKRILKCTKAGYWRSVPISDELKDVILNIRPEDFKSEGFVLKRHYAWTNGQAGAVLRAFLKDIGINKDIVFHTLRACFATHMLAAKVDQATVMKIGGWKDIKTFQIYVRLAGVEVSGATNALSVLPSVTQDCGSNVFKLQKFQSGS